jgi:hypothetical protein
MSGTRTVTIDAATWELHQRALGLLNKMADHPERGIEFKKMAKSIDKTLQFTDLDMAERIQAPVLEKLTAAEARLAAMETERDAEKLARTNDEQVRTLTADVDKAAKSFGLTEDGRKKMTERMQAKGNLDADAAAAWVASQAPKAKPNEGLGGYQPTALNPFGSAEKDDSVELLHTDPARWQDSEIAKILAEDPLAA